MTYILYANDVIIFGQAKISNVANMFQVIKQFCNLSGQHIDFEKSPIVASNRLESQVEYSYFIIRSSDVFKMTQDIWVFLLFDTSIVLENFHILLQNWNLRSSIRNGDISLLREEQF